MAPLTPERAQPESLRIAFPESVSVRPLSAIALAIAITTSGCSRERSGGADASAEPPADARAQTRARAATALARVPAIAFASLGRDGEHVGATGFSQVSSKREATPETVFEAASIAKLVVATCVLTLVEDGSLDLDADASRYVGFAVRHPRWPEPLTVRMLLTHRASIRDVESDLSTSAAGNPLGPFLKSYLVREAAPRATAFLEDRPGSRLTYSNVGASLAALAVEHVSGESFATFSARRVFAPLHMNRTSWAAPDAATTAVATPHAYRDGAFVALAPASHAVYPAVDLFASAADLARFARAILREGELDGARVLSAASVRTMLRADPHDADQALGWQLRTIGGRHVVGHEGEDAGATTGLFLDLAAGTGAVVLANGDAFGSGESARAEAIETMISELLAAKR